MRRRVEDKAARELGTGRKHFGECDGVVEEVKTLLQAGTELVNENVSNCQGGIWALGHPGDHAG